MWSVWEDHIERLRRQSSTSRGSRLCAGSRFAIRQSVRRIAGTAHNRRLQPAAARANRKHHSTLIWANAVASRSSLGRSGSGRRFGGTAGRNGHSRTNALSSEILMDMPRAGISDVGTASAPLQRRDFQLSRGLEQQGAALRLPATTFASLPRRRLDPDAPALRHRLASPQSGGVRRNALSAPCFFL